MTEYRIIEHKCSDGKSTFYVESHAGYWYSRWFRWRQGGFGDIDWDAKFPTMQAAQAEIDKDKAERNITCQDIIHPIT